jgi:hypothetical protein
MAVVVRYGFRQNFAVLADKAYLWCTDFDPKDHALMGEPNAKRKVTYLTKETLILNDTFKAKNGEVKKKKLIQRDPDQLRWVSTHLSGPNKYSQFIYEISAEKNGSTIEFTANHIEYQKLSEKETKQLTGKLRKHDVDIWALLAKAMENELNQ